MDSMLRRLAVLSALITATGCGGNFLSPNDRAEGAMPLDARESNTSSPSLQGEFPIAAPQSTSYFDIARDGVSFGNFSDLVYMGYCTGISALHAFTSLPAARRLSYLGAELNSLFAAQKDPKNAKAVHIVRSITTLSQSSAMIAALKNIDPSRLVTLEKIEAIYMSMQSEPLRSEGILAQLKGISDEQGTPTHVDHMVYIYKAELDGEIFRFSYVNPTQPKKTFVLAYDRRLFKNRSQTSLEFSQFTDADGGHFSWELYWPLSDFAAVLRQSLDTMKRDPKQEAMLRFLGFSTLDSAHLHDWKENASAINWLDSLDAARLLKTSPLRQQPYLTLSNFREYQKLMSVAQSQLDLSCDRFLVFYNFVKRRRPEIARMIDAELRDLAASYNLSGLDIPSTEYPGVIKDQLVCLKQKFL